MPLTLPVTDRDALLLADYAMRSAETEGRKHPELAHAYRSAFQRDRDRLTHCAAFRRLSHKTQVFTGNLGDYHRTRLTHTLEVASIARTLARALHLNEDLVEALALMHDMGHPPFGHAGEDVLNQRLLHYDASLTDSDGFNHNGQALRIVERLEIRYPTFAGLNLSHEVLEGQCNRSQPKKIVAGEDQPLLEVQVVDAADSIAYDAHDTDDALELGLLTISDLLQLPMWRDAASRVTSRFSNLTDVELRRAVIHELIDTEVSAMIDAAESRIARLGIDSVEAVRAASPMLTLPDELEEPKRELEDFLFARVYRHPDVLASRQVATEELGSLFDYFMEHHAPLPTPFQSIAHAEGRPRAVADYLSSLTDRSAREIFGHACKLHQGGVENE